jgi:long-chain fatty acid transport protein
MHRHARLLTPVVATLVILLATAVGAQTNDRVNAGIQFNFSAPGARSLGFGGAFLGLADDATAAYTNPAGLTNLSLPEVSFEGRSWKYTTEFADYGNTGTATNNANGKTTCQNGVGDCYSGVRLGTSDKSTSGLSFLSVVYPLNNWAVAFYRHELANFAADFRDQGIFYDTGVQETTPGRYYPSWAKMDLTVVNYGLSAAFRVSEQFSLGLGASYYEFDIDSTTDRYKTSGPNAFDPGGTYGLPLYEPTNRVNSLTQSGKDNAWGFNVGFLWKPSDMISVGGVYRNVPKFYYTSNLTRIDPANPPTVLEPSFDLPDVYGVGMAVRPINRLTITFDYDRVLYSQLVNNMMDFGGNPGFDPQNYVVDDANEFHLGVEYVFLAGNVAIPVRLGTWTDPDHKIRYEGQYPEEKAYFAGGKDQTHITGGFGIAVGKKFQIDVAYDHADLVKTGSLSAVIRF